MPLFAMKITKSEQLVSFAEIEPLKHMIKVADDLFSGNLKLIKRVNMAAYIASCSFLLFFKNFLELWGNLKTEMKTNCLNDLARMADQIFILHHCVRILWRLR